MTKQIVFQDLKATVLETADVNSFPTEGLYVQVLAEDELGEFVSTNNPIENMMGDEAFAQTLRCQKIRFDGYNTNSFLLVLFNENPKYQITNYMYGNIPFSFFTKVRGMQLELVSNYYGDDEKPGF
jgi:hypothetical protein